MTDTKDRRTGTGWARKAISHTAFPILALITLNLLIGALVFTHYGESWDENSILIYARNTLAAYRTVFTGDQMRPALYGPFNLRFYGPFFFALDHAFAAGMQALAPSIDVLHFWHLGYFLTFQIALASLYFLCLRWVSKGAALGATLLFNTQPLLWGHAFINPKDIPFLAFFLASVTTGLWMVDKYETQVQTPHTVAHAPKPLRECWAATPTEARRGLGLVGALAALLAFGIGSAPLTAWAESWARGVQAAGESGWSFVLLNQLAPNLDRIPLDTYLAKFALQAPRIKAAGALFLVVGVLLLVMALVPGLANSVRARLRLFLGRYTHPAVLPAGVLLGLAGALRVIAPAAGVLVAVYLLVRVGRRALPMLFLYFSLAALVTYASWPFLWGAPLAGLGETLKTMADFPKDVGIRFNGLDYRSIDLPASYFPVLVGIQLTEPALLLSIAGGGLVAWQWRRGRLKNPRLLASMAAWFLLPLCFFMLYRPTMYGNFRQFFFLLPPLFLFSALALEAVANRLRPVLYASALFLLLLPGLVRIVQLHPYEYVHYSELVGGVGGAARRFELDPWATSYREAIEYLNTIALENATVYLYGPNHMMRRFGRPDLVAVYEIASQQTDLSVYQYAILSSRRDTDLREFPDGEVIYRIERDGATLAVIKQLTPAHSLDLAP
jgi:hypothetical protein